MDQVKKGSKTLLDFFQASWAKKCKSNKGLDFSMLAQSTNDPSYATSSSEIGESHYSALVTKTCRTTVPHQNDPSNQQYRGNCH